MRKSGFTNSVCSSMARLLKVNQQAHIDSSVSPWTSIISVLTEHLHSLSSERHLHPDDVVLLEHLTGALFSRFPFSTCDYNKLPSLSRHDWIQAHRSAPPPLSLPLLACRLVNAAQRGSIPADLIKRVAYEATAGLHTLIHQQLPPPAPTPTLSLICPGVMACLIYLQ